MEELNVLDDTQADVVDSQEEPEQVEDSVSESAESEPAESVESEVATDTEDDNTQSKEENAKYAEIRRKYEAEKAEAVQKEKDKLISEMYGESHGIHTEAEYKKAIEEAKRQKEVEALKEEKGYDDEDAQAIYEAKKLKAEREKEAQSAKEKEAEQERTRKDNEDFLEWFKSENGRAYDSEKDKIPDAVWDKVKEGEPLKYAYMEHQYAELKKGKATKEKNAENAELALGAVKSGTAETALTPESIERMSEKEIADRWSEVKKVLGMR